MQNRENDLELEVFTSAMRRQQHSTKIRWVPGMFLAPKVRRSVPIVVADFLVGLREKVSYDF